MKWGGGTSTNGCFMIYIYLRANKTLIHNFCIYIFLTNGGKNLAIKDAVELQYDNGEGQADPDSQRPY